MSYIPILGLYLPPVVCRRAHVLYTYTRFVFTSSCLLEGACLIYLYSVRIYLQLFVGGRMSYLHIVLCLCFVFLRLMYPMLPVFLHCPFLIAPSIFSNVYFQCVALHLLWTLYRETISFRFPQDKATRDIDRQFLLGPAFLVTPVLEEVLLKYWIKLHLSYTMFKEKRYYRGNQKS
jgi:hypothetical protein